MGKNRIEMETTKMLVLVNGSDHKRASFWTNRMAETSRGWGWGGQMSGTGLIRYYMA